MGKTTRIALVASFGLVLGFTALQAIGDDLSAGAASKDTVPAPTPERTMVASVPDSAAVEADDQTWQHAAAPIHSSATLAYTPDMFPGLARKFGSAIPGIERERKRAAQIAAMERQCDEVMTVQITNGSTSNDRRYYADCKNRTRIFFDVPSIASGNPTGLQTWDAIIADGLEDW